MSTHQFNATEELNTLRQQQQLRRRRAYHHSRLHRYRAELVALRKVGASGRELAQWLRQNKRIRVAHTTVLRYLMQLPELKSQDRSTGDSECVADSSAVTPGGSDAAF